MRGVPPVLLHRSTSISLGCIVDGPFKLRLTSIDLIPAAAVDLIPAAAARAANNNIDDDNVKGIELLKPLKYGCVSI